MLNILKYFFSILVFISANCTAQYKYAKSTGLRIGYDLSHFLYKAIDPNHDRSQLSIDYEYKNNYFAVIEAGIADFKNTNKNYNYQNNGYFYTLGFEKNVGKEDLIPNNDIVTLGFRFGHSNYTQKATEIIVKNNYWDSESQLSTDDIKVKSNWVEAVFGVKAEVFKNIFLGFSLNYKIFAGGKDENMIYYIPGFGKYKKRTLIDFKYSIYYRFPIQL